MRKIKGGIVSFCVLVVTTFWLNGTLAAPSYCPQWLAPYMNSNPLSLAPTDSSVVENQQFLNQPQLLLNQLPSSRPTYSYSKPRITTASAYDTSTNSAPNNQVAVLLQNLITNLGPTNSNSVSIADPSTTSLVVSDVTINALTVQYNDVKSLVSSYMNKRSARVVNTALDALYKTLTNIVTGQLRNAELPNLCSKVIALNGELQATGAPGRVIDAVTDHITSLTLALTGQSQISLSAICSTLNDLETSVATVVQNDNSEKLQYLLSNLVDAVVNAVLSGGGSGCNIIDVVRRYVASIRQAIQEDANVRAGKIYNSIMNFEEELYDVLINTDPTAVVVTSQSLPSNTTFFETLESEYLVDIGQLAKSIFGDSTKLVKLAIQIFLNLKKSQDPSAGEQPTSLDPSETTLSSLQKVVDLLRSINESSQTSPASAFEMLLVLLSNTPQDDVPIILGALDPTLTNGSPTTTNDPTTTTTDSPTTTSDPTTTTTDSPTTTSDPTTTTTDSPTTTSDPTTTTTDSPTTTRSSSTTTSNSSATSKSSSTITSDPSTTTISSSTTTSGSSTTIGSSTTSNGSPTKTSTSPTVPSDTSDPVPLYNATVIVGDGENFIIKERVLEVKDANGNVLKSERSGTYKFTDPNTKISWSGAYGVQKETTDYDGDGTTFYEKSGVCTTYLPQATSDISTAPRVKRRAYFTVQETVVRGISDDRSPTVNDTGIYTLTDPVTGAFVSGTFIVENSITQLNPDGSKEIIKSGVLSVDDSDSTSSSDILSTVGTGDYALISYHMFNESDNNGNVGTGVIEITDPETGKYESGTAVIQQVISITNPDGSVDTTTSAVLYVDDDEDAVGENVVFKEHTTYVTDPFGQTSPITTGKFNRTNPTTGVTISDTYVVQNIVTTNNADGTTDITKFDKLSSNILATLSTGSPTTTSAPSNTTSVSSESSSDLSDSTSDSSNPTKTLAENIKALIKKINSAMTNQTTTDSESDSSPNASSDSSDPASDTSDVTSDSSEPTSDLSDSTSDSSNPAETLEDNLKALVKKIKSALTNQTATDSESDSSSNESSDTSDVTSDSSEPSTDSSDSTDTLKATIKTLEALINKIESGQTNRTATDSSSTSQSPVHNATSIASDGTSFIIDKYVTPLLDGDGNVISQIIMGTSYFLNPQTNEAWYGNFEINDVMTKNKSSSTTELIELGWIDVYPTNDSLCSLDVNVRGYFSIIDGINSAVDDNGISTTTETGTYSLRDSNTSASKSGSFIVENSVSKTYIDGTVETVKSGFLSVDEPGTTSSKQPTLEEDNGYIVLTYNIFPVADPDGNYGTGVYNMKDPENSVSTSGTYVIQDVTTINNPDGSVNSEMTGVIYIDGSNPDLATAGSMIPYIVNGSSFTINDHLVSVTDSNDGATTIYTGNGELIYTNPETNESESLNYVISNMVSIKDSDISTKVLKFAQFPIDDPTVSATDDSTKSLQTLIETLNLLNNILNPVNPVTQNAPPNTSGLVTPMNMPTSSTVPSANSSTSTNDFTVDTVDPTTIMIDGAVFILDQHVVPQLDFEGNVVNVTKTGRFSFTDPVTNVSWSGNVEVDEYSATSTTQGQIDVVESGTFTVNLPDDASSGVTDVSDPASFEIQDHVSVVVDNSGASMVTEDGTFTLTNPKTGNSVTGNFVIETSVSKNNSDGSMDTIKSGTMYVNKFCSTLPTEEPSPLSNGGYFLFDDHIFATPASDGSVGTGVYSIKDPNTDEYTSGTYLIQGASNINNSDGSVDLKTNGLIYVDSSHSSTNSTSTDPTLAIINGAQFTFDDHLTRVKGDSGELNTVGTGTLTQTDPISGIVRTGTYNIQSANFKTNSDGSQDTIKSGTFRYTNDINTTSDPSGILATLLSQLSSGLSSNSSLVTLQKLISILKTAKTELGQVSTADPISPTDLVVGSTYVRLPRSDVVSAINGQNLLPGDAVAIQTNNGDALLATIQDFSSPVTFYVTSLADLAQGFANATRVWTVPEDNFSKPDRAVIDALLESSAMPCYT